MTQLLGNRNLWILFCGQMIAVTGSSHAVTLGGIVGQELAFNKALATLPQAFHVIGIAVFAIPAAMIMRRVGRPLGFSIASVMGAVSQLLGAWAIYQHNFWLFTGALMLLGCSSAFAMQLRFAAAESIDSHFAARAISFVLAGAIGGAFAGPMLASRAHSLFGVSVAPYTSGFMVQTLLFFAMAMVFLLLSRIHIKDDHTEAAARRPLRGLVGQPVFMVAVLAGVTSYVVMILIMTATPLSMHVKDGFTLEQTASVIRAHVLGMYVPALVSGYLVDRFGIGRMLVLGISVLAVCLSIALAGHQYVHYWWALLLLGIGWNFLYVSGTALLTKTYRQSERYTAQAINEFSIFGVSALAALMAGVLIHNFGWNTTVRATIAPLIILALAVWFVRRRSELGRVAPAIV